MDNQQGLTRWPALLNPLLLLHLPEPLVQVQGVATLHLSDLTVTGEEDRHRDGHYSGGARLA